MGSHELKVQKPKKFPIKSEILGPAIFDNKMMLLKLLRDELRNLEQTAFFYLSVENTQSYHLNVF